MPVPCAVQVSAFVDLPHCQSLCLFLATTWDARQMGRILGLIPLSYRYVALDASCISVDKPTYQDVEAFLLGAPRDRKATEPLRICVCDPHKRFAGLAARMSAYPHVTVEFIDSMSSFSLV